MITFTPKPTGVYKSNKFVINEDKFWALATQITSESEHHTCRICGSIYTLRFYRNWSLRWVNSNYDTLCIKCGLKLLDNVACVDCEPYNKCYLCNNWAIATTRKVWYWQWKENVALAPTPLAVSYDGMSSEPAVCHVRCLKMFLRDIRFKAHLEVMT